LIESVEANSNWASTCDGASLPLVETNSDRPSPRTHCAKADSGRPSIGTDTTPLIETNLGRPLVETKFNLSLAN